MMVHQHESSASAASFSDAQLGDLLRDLQVLMQSPKKPPVDAAPLPVVGAWSLDQFIADEDVSGGREGPAAFRPLPSTTNSSTRLSSWGDEVRRDESYLTEERLSSGFHQTLPSSGTNSEAPSSVTPPMHLTPPTSPTDRTRGTPAVEPTKFRTKFCKNWSTGLHCPFGDRCAFAHGNEQIRRADAPNTFFDVYSAKSAAGPPTGIHPTTNRHAPFPSNHAAPAHVGIAHRRAMPPTVAQSTAPNHAAPACLDWQHQPTDAFVDNSGCFWYGN
ncbi:zinc finger protein ZFP1 [Diplonema papillatum]|nr:zinc finger protein ZFP1 [Diplonema papillatum]